MRFLLDVNVGTTIARALEDAGHDIVRAALSNATTRDPDLLALAIDGRRILVTYDRDFSNLIFHAGSERPVAVIYIGAQPQDVADILPRLLSILDLDHLSGHITVIGRTRTRRTLFPVRSDDNG